MYFLHPLENLRTRTLINWFFIVFLFLVILGYFYTDRAIINLATSLSIYGSVLLWSYIHFFSRGIKWKPFMGKVKSKYILESSLLIFLLLLFSLGSYWIIFLPLSKLYPETALDIINQHIYLTKEDSSYSEVYNQYLFFEIAIIAPFVEEIFFRGILFQRLSYKWGTTNGIILSSFFFAIPHGFDFIGAFAFGVIACLLYLKSRSLWLPLFIHIANNVIILLLNDNNMMKYNSIQDFFNKHDGELTVLIASLLVSIPLVVWYARKNWGEEMNIYPYNYVVGK